MNGFTRFRSFLRVLIVGLCFIVSGCKLDLYTMLSEREANEMLAVLVANGVNAQKEYVGDEGVTLRVESSELARAIDILSQNGFPREKKESIGKVFEKSGIMSSPFEEHVRYNYALGEEISKTLIEIDGVLTARVHIVLPEDPDIGDKVSPSSAAVFIKHRRGVDLDFFAPQIRRLTSNAIEGVDYQNVTVVLVEAGLTQVLGDPVRTPIVELFPGMGVRAGDEQSFWNIVRIAGCIFIVLLISNIVTLVGYFRACALAKQHSSGAALHPDFAE